MFQISTGIKHYSEPISMSESISFWSGDDLGPFSASGLHLLHKRERASPRALLANMQSYIKTWRQKDVVTQVELRVGEVV